MKKLNTNLDDAELKRMRDRYKGKGKSNKVPIHTIEIMWHEGTTKPGSNLEGKRYSDWYDYQNALKRINDDNKKDRPYGTYTKTKGRFTWADGTQETARIDLGENDFDPDHIYQGGKNKGKRMYIGDYYRQTLRDGRRGEDGRWRAFDPPRYIKSRTGRELGTGHRDDRKLDKDGYFRRPGGKSVRQTAPPPAKDAWAGFKPIEKGSMGGGLGHCKKCGDGKMRYVSVVRDKSHPSGTKHLCGKCVKGKASQAKQPEKVLGSYSSKGHRPQKSKPWTSKKGPGSGWHGQIARHRMAALKGRRP